MNTHPYLRAYLAGVFVPTLVLPLLLTVFIVVRIVLQGAGSHRAGMIFPMAVVPSLFGLWNMLWLGSISARICPSACMGRFCRW